MSTEGNINIRVSPQVARGFTTYLGIGSSVLLYGGSVVTFLLAPDQEAALGPFLAATLALYKVLAGRFSQADRAIEASGAVPGTKFITVPESTTLAERATIETKAEAGSTPRPFSGGTFRIEPTDPS